MGFLSGPISFDCFRIDGEGPRQFGTQQVKILEKFAIGKVETTAIDQPDVGFLGGQHLLDCSFGLEKNVIGDALHCGMRVDTRQIPAAVRKAWLQMELAVLAADNPSGRPTKAQRQEAKEAVESRCEEEARGDRFRRMQQFPLLWDGRDGMLYFGSSSATAIDHCCDLCSRAFDIELGRLTAGKRAIEWATEAKQRKHLDGLRPAIFHKGGAGEISWWNGDAGNFDFLGNEFLLWLWWRWETKTDTVELPDGSEVTGMISRTLSLQCPRDETGKETISAEAPSRLPEAAQAIRSGKLPRKAGLILVRHGVQYDLVLQSEMFSISGAKIQMQEPQDSGDVRGVLEERIDSLRDLHETVDLLFRAFCTQRIGKNWPGELEHMRQWLRKPA